MLIDTMTKRSTVLPLATITKAVAMEGGDWIVTDAQGEDHRVSNVAWELAVEGTPAAMMPALLGTYLVSPGEDETGKRKVWKNNVLGWMVAADTEIRPLVLDMSMIEDRWTVMHPDGRVERNDGESWETVDQWLDSVTQVSEAA
jgi:hypothetical protein